MFQNGIKLACGWNRITKYVQTSAEVYHSNCRESRPVSKTNSEFYQNDMRLESNQEKCLKVCRSISFE